MAALAIFLLQFEQPNMIPKLGDGGVKMVKASRDAFRLSARLCLRPHSGGYGGAARTPITLSC